MTEDTPTLTVSDARVLYCVPGIRKMFHAQGADFERFLREGMTADELRSYGWGAIVDRVIEHKAQRNGR